jgi:hypothetical protein
MIRIRLISDHFNNWSDYHETKVYSYSPTKEKDPFTQASVLRSHFAWFFNRALQALRQARVQVRRWPRSWSKVLFISKQAWATSPDGLCSSGFPGKCTRLLGKLSKDKDHFRRALRNQPGTFTPKGEVLARSPPKVRDYHDSGISDRC